MFDWLKSKKETDADQDNKPSGFFSTDVAPVLARRNVASVWARTFQRKPGDFVTQDGMAMDSATCDGSASFSYSTQQSMPDAQFLFFASQGFIGYQAAAMLAQNWLIDKCCTIPARDAVRNGYEVTVNNGADIAPEIIDDIRRMDKRFKVKANCVEFVKMCRVFGVRIALFVVDNNDPDYYQNPFNPDGVTPGSYKGISQIDPYWVAPELSREAASNPSAIGFYRPTYWLINGKRVHHSHVIMITTGEVADILKPTYLYGGIPLPQKIAERVYAAERTANEAPMLAMTKRQDVLNLDMSQALLDQRGFEEKLKAWTLFRDNYGVKILGESESMQRLDTSLSDLDAVIMTQYQIVAAAANIPVTKLLNTQPKGFNSTGEFEAKNYHEELESIQEADLTPLIERHHLLLMRSYIAPKWKIEPFDVTIEWKPVNPQTSMELADMNLKRSQVDVALASVGAIDGADVRKRIISDPQSGYNGLKTEEEPLWPDDEDKTE